MRMTPDHRDMLIRINEFNLTEVTPTPVMLVRGLSGKDRAKAYRILSDLERHRHIRNVSTSLYGKEYRAS